MKLYRMLLPILFVALSGCSDPRPTYESGVSLETYGEQVGSWLGGKIFKDKSEKEVESYRYNSNAILKDYRKKVGDLKSPDALLQATDKMVADILLLAESSHDLSLDDWLFLSNPKFDNSVNEISQIKIKYAFKQIMQIFPQSSAGYFPIHLGAEIQETLISKNNQSDVYYFVLKNSAHKRLIANDSWLEKNEQRMSIIGYAKKIALSEKLYFDVDLDELNKVSSAIFNIENDYRSNRHVREIFSADLDKNNMSLTEFADMANSMSVGDFKKRLRPSSLNEQLKQSQQQLKKHLDQKSREVTIEYWQSEVDYYLKSIDEESVKREVVFANAKNKITELLEELNNLKNDDNRIKHRHNMTVFSKTYRGVVDLGYQNEFTSFLTNSNHVYNLDKYDPITMHDLGNEFAHIEYLKIMKKLLNKSS